MNGLQFRIHKPVRPSAPNRVDIACFVGLVGFRNQSSPDSIEQTGVGEWLAGQGWQSATDRPPASHHHQRVDAATLLDVPVPIESWDIFDRLYAWDERPVAAGLNGGTYLGAAVRSFFAQGGRKCYVVRVGDPLPLAAPVVDRSERLADIIPGYFPKDVRPNRSDRASWRGVGHLFGLPDVSFLCLPDLADLVQTEIRPAPAKPPEPLSPPEQFVECSEPLEAPPADPAVTRMAVPRCGEDGYTRWHRAIRMVARLLATHRREVQLVAGIPLPVGEINAWADLLAFMHEKDWLSDSILIDPTRSLASAFVQLCYPWLRTGGSGRLPQRLEPPEGALAGLLARNALTRGTFRSATALRQQDIDELWPKLNPDQIYALNPRAPDAASPKTPFVQRVSLFARQPEGIRLVSDVTTSNSVIYRQASINRILALVVRAARRAGEEFVFESSGEQLWARLRNRLTDLLQTLFSSGALGGATPAEAYQVRCDRSVMTQQDIDSGRVTAHIIIQPAASIETIDVLLTMGSSGQVSLAKTGIQETAA